jgi:hypothetical protein
MSRATPLPIDLQQAYRYIHIPHHLLHPALKEMDPAKRGFVARLVGERAVVPQGPLLGKRHTLEQNKKDLARIAAEHGLQQSQVGSAPVHRMFFRSASREPAGVGRFPAKKTQLFYRVLTDGEREAIHVEVPESADYYFSRSAKKQG